MCTPHRTTLLLLIATAALYAPTLGYGFVYEDAANDAQIFRPFEVRDVLVKPARSLTALSYEMNASLFGPMNPVGYHLGNVALHLVNGALVYALALVILAPWPSVMAAAVFLLHPLQVESVAYVSSRSELVSTACVLLALLAASQGWALAALLAVALAVAGKESAIVAGLLVPLWAAWTRSRTPIWAVGLWSIALVVGAAYFIAQYPLTFDPVYAGSQLASLGWLLSRVVIPVGLSIDPDLRWSAEVARFALCMGVALGVTALWSRSIWTFAAVWCVIAILPRLVVPLHEGLHFHHLYLPLVGVALACGSLVQPRRVYGISPARA